jgi:hypothetical protein
MCWEVRRLSLLELIRFAQRRVALRSSCIQRAASFGFLREFRAPSPRCTLGPAEMIIDLLVEGDGLAIGRTGLIAAAEHVLARTRSAVVPVGTTSRAYFRKGGFVNGQ